MVTSRWNMMVAVFLAAMTVVGCGSPATEGEARESAPPQEPEFIVCLVDRSGSFEDLTEFGFLLCRRLVTRARPGDELIFRYISGRSYANDQIFAHIQFPEGRKLAQAKVFSGQARQRIAVAKEQVRRIKTDALARLDAMKPERSGHTDIIGGMAAAADHFSVAAPGVARGLYICSDLKDTVNYNFTPDLQDVEVYIALKHDPDPAKTLRLRSEWEKFFDTCGAVKVTWLPAEHIREPMTEVDDKR